MAMNMAPFDRYLQPSLQDDKPTNSDQTPPSTANPYSRQYDDHRPGLAHSGYPSSSSSSVQFQMPPFMYAGPPTLAPGGGAEVLPPGLFASSGGITSSWLANNGFSSPTFPLGSNCAQSPSGLTPFDDYLRRDSVGPPSAGPSALQTSNLPYENPIESSPSAPWASSPRSPVPPAFQNSLSISAPSALGLPVYSASGFDILSILGRVATRPHPKIQLGPVDLTCSFTITDVRRYDNPIVYVSPTFTQLTGYEEAEVVGRNCRFLQSPDGRVNKGEERRYTASDSVNLLRKALGADKEVQTSLVNYKKGGEAFVNLVTVIPIAGGVNNNPHEQDEVAYHVGFQVDLTRQPNAILQRLKDGSYIVNYSSSSPLSPSVGRRGVNAPATQAPMSQDLRTLLSSKAFLRSLPLSTRTNAVLTSDKPDDYDDHQLLDMLILEALPDFVHVLSLKGVFLYVAPSVRRVLGYAPEDLLGKSVADICHPADLVPLMRELKESSAAAPPGGDAAQTGVVTGVQSIQAALNGGPSAGGAPRTVDLLFRARAKDGSYAWLDCRGRLHVEPGKGRKAIIMSGRQRGMPRLRWGTVGRAGGLVPATHIDPAPQPESPHGDEGAAAATAAPRTEEREFWAELSPSGTVLFVGGGVRDVLGWGVGELIGRTIADLLDAPDERARLEQALARSSGASHAAAEAEGVPCEMRGKDARRVPVHVVLYRSEPDAGAGPSMSSLGAERRAPAPVVAQVKVLAGDGAAGALVHEHGTHVFEELETERGTSWQYELQQLKYANRRLADEVDALEAGAAAPSSADAVARNEDGPEWGGAYVSKKRSWDATQDVGEPT